MSTKKTCTDIYGEKLAVGDYVIPIMEEALILGIEGYITDIIYNDYFKNYYITISDEHGNILIKNIDAECYTTKKRLNERENNTNIYSLTFYDKDFYPITNIPLSNQTNKDFLFPKGTSLISLDAEFLLEQHSGWTSRLDEKLFYFLTKENKRKFELYFQQEGKYFNNEEELAKYIQKLIEFFNNSDLTNIQTTILFKENKEAQEFDKTLRKKIEKNKV